VLSWYYRVDTGWRQAVHGVEQVVSYFEQGLNHGPDRRPVLKLGLVEWLRASEMMQ